MKNVLLIKGSSQYNAMRNYIDEIEVGFRLLGYNTYVADAKKESILDLQINQIYKHEHIDIIFTCNAMMWDCEALFETFPNAVYITYLCDHPAIHKVRLETMSCKCIVFTCDKRHEQYIKKYYSNIKFVKFIPLSGSYFKKYIPFDKRSHEIIFTGSYRDPDELKNRLLDEFSGSLMQFVQYMMNLIIEQPEKDIEQCLEETLQVYNVQVSDKEFLELAYDFCDIDKYARFYYRDKVIRKLLENGLKVHVFGSGWDQFKGTGCENLIIEQGNYYLALKAVADSKISLNVMPWFKAGFQERIATAMLSGTVAVTDKSEYIDNNFTDEKELLIYDLKHIDELPNKIKDILADPEKAQNIAKEGMDCAQTAHTWQHRTIDFVHYMEICYPELKIDNEGIGEQLSITYDTFHIREIAVAAMNDLKTIETMLESIQNNDKIEWEDIQYWYIKVITIYMNAKENYPELQVSAFIYNYITGVQDRDASRGLELLLRECSFMKAFFLNMEEMEWKKEKNNLMYQLQETQNKPNIFSQKILIKKMKQNYGNSEDKDVKEILENVQKNQWVEAYNQNFVAEHINGGTENGQVVGYDQEAEMCYALWNGKRMYYPKGYTQGDVVASVNFVNLEQDVKSPHRYLEENFNVDEGDIVIDAGVAEGNFALDIVEKVKKLYLVECEHKWIEALNKTFEPWKEKVVIIEKMLGSKDDENYASIDNFVEEGYVNFIKMDVEGAEIDSLIGAASVLENSKKIKCAICAYHRKNAERDIRNILEQHHFYTSTTKGYMFFKEDLDSWIDGELRHGLVRAVKMDAVI